MANNITDKNGKKVKYSVTTNYLVDYADGTAEGSFILKPTQAQVQADWNSKNVAPPVVVNPIPPNPPYIPPVINNGNPKTITYKDFQNLNGADNENLVVSAATVTDQCGPTDCNNTTVDLSAVKFTVKGMPAVEIGGLSNGFAFIGANFQDCDNACFSYKWNKLYDGTAASFVQGLILQGIIANNCGHLFQNSASGPTSKGFTGVISGLQILGSTFKNSANVGNVVEATALENYLIQGNIVDNINTQNSDHNGIFMVGGNGVFSGNKCTNHQGNVLRSQPYAIISDSSSVLCTKNIGIGSTRYSFAEFQVMPADLQAFPAMKAIKEVDVIYNVAGTLSTDHQRNGVLIDLYNLSANPIKDVINVDYNTGFNMFALNGQIGNMIANQGSGIPNVGVNNKYYPTVALAQAAGVAVS